MTLSSTKYSKKRREQVLEIIRRSPWSSAAEVALETGLTAHSIRRILGELEAAGMVAMRLESMRERDRRVATWRATQPAWLAYPGGVNGRRFLYAISGEPTPEALRGHPGAGPDEQPDPHAARIRERNRKRFHDQFNAHLKWRQRQWEETHPDMDTGTDPGTDTA